MTFAVFWGPPTEQELANAWLLAPDRDAVVRAAHQIEQQLGRNPLAFGESRESSVSRLALIPPLGVTFEVIVDDARVFVTGVWLAG